MTEKEKMLAGVLYNANDPMLDVDHNRTQDLLWRYNAAPFGWETHGPLLKKLLGSVGKNSFFKPPFLCDYGFNIHVGDNFFANFGCIVLDVCRVTIGSGVLFGPRVGLYAAAHPIDADIRCKDLLEYGKSITIKDNAWIGGGAIVNPGITIGENTVIGSGSVVTKDIPPNVIAVGNPCRVLRDISSSDREYWEKLKEESFEGKKRTL